MASDSNVAPVIIKRKKVISGGGHHGGAWKVAYADFVTAMMAFFLLMWLLNATTEKQRKGIADYFSLNIAINRVSGGGDGSFWGDSVFSEDTLPRVGTGATSLNPTEQRAARGSFEDGPTDPATEAEQQDESFEMVEELLRGRGGESMVADDLLEHIVTRVTDEGLVVELYETADAPLFQGAQPTVRLRELAQLIVAASDVVTNSIAVEGHTAAYPVVLARNPSWDLSGARADMFSRLLSEEGMPDRRISRTTAHADREPARDNLMDPRNNRLEVVFLRDV